MKKTNSLLILGILSTLSLSAFAQNRPYYDIDNDRYSRDDLRHNFRDANIRRDMRDYSRRVDICQDVTQNLVIAEDAYVNASDMMTRLNQKVSTLETQTSRKRTTLSNLQRDLNNANAEVNRLADYQNRKPQLLNHHAGVLDNMAREIPKKESLLKRQKDQKEQDCRGLGLSRRCRNAKKAVKQTQRELDDLYATRNSSNSMISFLNNLDNSIVAANKERMKAEARLVNEQSKVPTLATLEVQLAEARNVRNNQTPALSQARVVYGETAIRAEKCQIMKFEARKSRVFKQAIVDLAANNGANCDGAPERIRRIRGFAAKEAMTEAYEMVCVSDQLVRYVEVPATPAN